MGMSRSPGAGSARMRSRGTRSGVMRSLGRYRLSQASRSVSDVPISAGMDTTPGLTLQIRPPPSRMMRLPSGSCSSTSVSNIGKSV